MIAAIAHVPAPTLAKIRVGKSACIVVVDACELAGNLGAIIRCADGAGAIAVVVTERQVRITHGLVVKASMGTVFTTP